MYLFIYGTLLNGLRNNFLLSNSEYTEEVLIDNYQMYNTDKRYPVLLKSETTNKIKGELYNIKYKSIINNLDQLEKYNEFDLEKSIFIRTPCIINNISSFVYILNENLRKHIEQDRIIESNDYKHYLREIK